MAKPQYEITTRCIGGINQNLEKASLQQCADALNVWAPDGAVVQRPGYTAVGVAPFLWSALPGGVTFITEDVSGPAYDVATPWPAGGFVVRQNLSAVAGDRWYVGMATPGGPLHLQLSLAVAGIVNANILSFDAEYWNGTDWTPLYVSETAYFTGYASQPPTHLGPTNPALVSSFFIPQPKDHATTTVAGVTAYFTRFTFVQTTAAVALSAGVEIDAATPRISAGCVGGFVAKAPGLSRTIVVGAQGVVFGGVAPLGIANATSPQFTDFSVSAITDMFTTPVTLAVVPEIYRAYLTTGAAGNVYQTKLTAVGAADPRLATVEAGNWAVGAGAPWDRNVIAQLSTYPKAKFISYFQNRMWLVDENNNLRWSAATPYQDVWPALAYEPLTEVDNSEPTGIYPLQEHMVVFKQDSIWVASFSDFDAFEIPHFIPRKVVSGIGCVAHSTIRPVRGELVFLSEEGIFAFDGVNARKVTTDHDTGADRLEQFISTITPGKRPFATGVNWSTRHVYLLAVPVNGSEYNNAVVAWDYLNDTFWLWDGIDVVFWMLDEDQYDNEVLYFGDQTGTIYQFGIGNTDFGRVISAYVTTVKLGYHDGVRKALTDIDIESNNDCAIVGVDVMRNGQPATFAERQLLGLSLTSNDQMYYPAVDTEWAAKYGESFGYLADRTVGVRALRVGNMDHCQLRIRKLADAGTFYLSKVTAGFTPFRGR